MLRISEKHRRAIGAHGERGYPEEICGFLIGTIANGTKTVDDLVPIENAWDDGTAPAEFAQSGHAAFGQETRRRRFQIPPDEYYRAAAAAREKAPDRDVLGFYHSHPDHPARPSRYDLELARETIPGYSYIIVSIHDGKAVDLTSWVLRDDYSQFDAEEMADGDG